MLNPKDKSMHAEQGLRITRRHVAEMAKVSPATVTYALNPSDRLRIGEETCRRVRRIAREMGYRPNFVHRALSAGRTYAVGLVIPSEESLFFTFYDAIIGGVMSAMNAGNYDPMLLSRNRWDRVEQVVQDGRLDGLFVLQSDLDDTCLRKACGLGVPLVVLNRDLPSGAPEHAACVYSDHRRMMREVIDEFVGSGCRTILNFSDTRSTFAHAVSFDAFNEQVAKVSEQGIIGSTIPPVWDHFVPQARNLVAAGQRWDGIFVNGSPVADALVKECAVNGLEPGKDFQLITTDAFRDLAPYRLAAVPAVRCRSSYLQQPRVVGETGWRLMQELVEGRPPACREVMVPYVRETCPEGKM